MEWSDTGEAIAGLSNGRQDEAHPIGHNGTQLDHYAGRQHPLRPSTKSTPNLSIASSTPEAPPVTLTVSTSSNTWTNSGQRPYNSPRSASNDSYRTGPGHAPHITNLRHKPSEAARLRVMSNGSFHSPTDTRHKLEASPVEEHSRARRPASKGSGDSPRLPLNTSSSFPLQAREDASVRHGPPVTMRDRGRSTSSSRSTSTFSSMPLRPSTSIPDYSTIDKRHSRQRNPNNVSNHRPPWRGYTDSNIPNTRREPNFRPNGFDSEEVRASIRSALTTTSSFLGTSGTERSSVMTKSSATSIFGQDEGLDEGMSVDDAIGMYENGFADSGAEDDYPSRSETSFSHKFSNLKPHESKNETNSTNYFLGVPAPPKFIIRDSAAIFQEPEGGFGSLDGNISSSENASSSNRRLRLKPRGVDGNNEHLSHSAKRPSSSPYGEERDRYGFQKKSQHVSSAQYESWNGPYAEYLGRRRKKWVALLKEANLPTEDPVRFPPKTSKVKRFIRKGIPPDWRGAAWFYYAGGPAMVARHCGLYDNLLHRAANGDLSTTDAEIIERDLNRTFPDNIRFKPDPKAEANSTDERFSTSQTLVEPETPILKSLRRVLQAFSIYNPRIGYCQSLNFLAGLLLLFMDEEKSFWLLNIITREYLPGTHEVNLEGANVDLGVLMTSVKESMPAIWAKIGGELDGSAASGYSNLNQSMRLPPITLCCSAWFMSCFIGTLPIETTLRVWDSFFYEGSKTLFRISLAIFKVGEQEIKAVNDPMEIFQVVQTIPRRLIDASALMEACYKRRNGFGHLSHETIEAKRAERRKGYADERARIAAGLPPPPDAMMERKGTIFSRRRGKSRVREKDMEGLE